MQPVDLPDRTKNLSESKIIRILLVDDREDHYIMTRRLFSSMRGGGYVIDWVNNYTGALEAIQRSTHDVYLIDYHLGPDNGIDLVREARRAGCQAPMIVFTSSANPSADVEALNAGATDYLTKGRIDPVLLERTIRYAIEHTRQIEALRQSRRFTQTIISSAGEGLVVYDEHLNCTIWNQFMEELTGIPSAQVIGSSNLPLLHQLFGQEPESLLQQVLAGKTTCLPEVQFHISATGKWGWISLDFRPLVSTNDQITGVVITIHDNTIRRQAEEALRRSEERLRLALDAAVVGTLDWDIVNDQMSHGGNFDQLFGLQSGLVQLSFQSFLRYIHPEDRPLVEDSITSAMVEGARFSVEFRINPRQDDEGWIAAQGQVYLDETGRAVRVGGVVQDVTDRKLLEQERLELLRREQAARRASEEANAMKVRFLAMVSHELRTPLASIKGFTSTLLAPDVDWNAEQYHEFLTVIDEETEKLSELIAQLMDITRLQAGVLPIELAPQSLADVLRGATAQLEATLYDHELITDIAPDIPMVMADKRRIEQVIVNLVQNAVKYSPAGTQIHLYAYPNGSDTIEVDVDDQGPGIPVDQRERVFEPFHQLAKGASSQKGAGLGLAICKELVEAHGGQIWIQDKSGPGTKISFTLRIAE